MDNNDSLEKVPVADAAIMLGLPRTQIYYYRDRGMLDVKEPLDGVYGRYITMQELVRFQNERVNAMAYALLVEKNRLSQLTDKVPHHQHTNHAVPKCC